MANTKENLLKVIDFCLSSPYFKPKYQKAFLNFSGLLQNNVKLSIKQESFIVGVAENLIFKTKQVEQTQWEDEEIRKIQARNNQ